MQKSLSDLLGAHSIDNWVEDGWDEEIKVGQENMDMGRHMMAKAMGERRDSNRDIEDKDGTDVRPTCP